jgi:thermitase
MTLVMRLVFWIVLVLAIAAPGQANARHHGPAAAGASATTLDAAAGWAPQRVQAPAAWSLTTGSPSVIIAVLDTGVDATHPDLAGGKVVGGRDFVNGTLDAADDSWHGTAVAGVAAAARVVGPGAFSYCPGCSILAVKVLDSEEQGDDAEIARGIVWAVDRGARVINLSLAGFDESAALRASLRYAADKRVIVVAAAGNDGESSPAFPAADPTVVGVAATDPSDRVYGWSNRGRWVTLAAPGVAESTLRGGSYVRFVGTSAAAPAVSGTIGLCLSVAPGLSPGAVKKALVKSADPIRGSGFGRLNAGRAVAACAAAGRH